jgi:ribosomal protein S18 acetylase RimI-like enzyme
MEEAELRARAWAGVARQQRLFGEHVPGASTVKGEGWTGSLVPTASESALLNVAVPDDPAVVPPLHELREVFGRNDVRWGVWADGTVASDSHLMLAGMQAVNACRLMARELRHLSATAPAGVEPTRDLRWVGALNDRAYGLTDGRLETHFGVIESDAVHAHRLSDLAVAAAVDNAGDASLFFVATAPHARNQGHGTTVVMAALAAARERGCTTASLLATADGSGLYARLGFVDLGPAQLWATRRP